MHPNAIAQLKNLKDWRNERYLELYNLILESNSNFLQDWKWGTLIFTLNKKNKIALGVFDDKLKLNLFEGAKLDDIHNCSIMDLNQKTLEVLIFLKKTILIKNICSNYSSK